MMPWTGAEFASRHNKKLKGGAAKAAARQANAMLKSGVPEGLAIATANKRAGKLRAKAEKNRGSRGERWYGNKEKD